MSNWITKLWIAAKTQVFLSSVSHQNLNHMLALLKSIICADLLQSVQWQLETLLIPHCCHIYTARSTFCEVQQ